MLDTCGVKIWLPGITDTATLKMASELCGQASFTERVHYRGADRGEDRRAWHDAMTPDMIRQLPGRYALVVRGGLMPVIARLGAAWQDRSYKNARRAGIAVAALVPAPPPAGLAGGAIGGRPALPPYLTIVPDPDHEADDARGSEAAGGESPGYPWS